MNTEEITSTFQSGITAAQAGKRILARLQFEKVRQLSPSCIGNWIWLAWTSDSPEQAIEYLEAAKKYAPNDFVLNSFLSLVHHLNDFDLNDVDSHQIQRSPSRSLADSTPQLDEMVEVTASDVSPAADHDEASVGQSGVLQTHPETTEQTEPENLSPENVDEEVQAEAALDSTVEQDNGAEQIHGQELQSDSELSELNSFDSLNSDTEAVQEFEEEYVDAYSDAVVDQAQLESVNEETTTQSNEVVAENDGENLTALEPTSALFAETEEASIENSSEADSTNVEDSIFGEQHSIDDTLSTPDESGFDSTSTEFVIAESRELEFEHVDEFAGNQIVAEESVPRKLGDRSSAESCETPRHDVGDEKPLILAVDDSPTVRKLVSMTLEPAGYRVVTAENGLEAVKLFGEITPQLILLDVNMPKMNGYKLCKLIKSQKATKNIPVVMLSGKDGVFDKLRGTMVGCSEYLSKPFEAHVLLNRVGSYVRPAVMAE